MPETTYIFALADGTREKVWGGSPRYRELIADGLTPEGTVPPDNGISDALEAFLAGLVDESTTDAQAAAAAAAQDADDAATAQAAAEQAASDAAASAASIDATGLQDGIDAAQAAADAAQTTADGKVSVGWTNHSIMEYAAGATINDGVTSASAAITAALAAIGAGTKQRLWFPPGTYLDDAARTISKSVRMVGDGATIKKGTTTVPGNWWTLNADDIQILDLTVDDSAGKITGSVFVGNISKNRLTVAGNTINAPSAIIFQATQGTDVKYRENLIQACRQGSQFNGAITRLDVRLNRITNWRDRGIYVVGNASGCVTALDIVGNVVSDMTLGGVSRYPVLIAAGASAVPHSAVLLECNTVLGSGLSYTAASPGNADCFGLFAIDGLRVLGNTARDGGDMGITLDGTGLGVKRATVVGNVCQNNDTGGISVAGGARDVSVVGNVCQNNGQNRNGDRPASGRAGVWLNIATNVGFSGNTFGDDQGTKTQQYGVSLASGTNVSLGPDIDGGNAAALYVKNGVGNTNIVKVTTAAF